MTLGTCVDFLQAWITSCHSFCLLLYHASMKSKIPCDWVPSWEGKPKCAGVKTSDSLLCKVVPDFSSPLRWFLTGMNLDGALYPFQKPLHFGPRVLPNEASWWTEQGVQITVLTEDTAKKRRWLRSKPSWRKMELLSQNICDGKKCKSSMSTQTRKGHHQLCQNISLRLQTLSQHVGGHQGPYFIRQPSPFFTGLITC